MQVGGFVYPFHESSTPKAELEKRLGYQTDPRPPSRRRKQAHGGGRLRPGPQGARLRGARHRQLQALGAWPSRPC